jgi:hypothetical protein
LSRAQEANVACEKCALAAHLEGRSLMLAGSNVDVGTALTTCHVRTACERLAAPRRWWWYACPEVPGRP